MTPSYQDDVTWWVYERSLRGRLLEAAGWALGWVCFGISQVGLTQIADRLIDAAIMLRRGNPGAIRAVGYLNGLQGKLALRRGRVLVEGVVGPTGPFANKCFYASYHVAARDEARALQLIRRWEWDAVPSSLKIVKAEFDLNDDGAEGILWVSNGRTFYTKADGD